MICVASKARRTHGSFPGVADSDLAGARFRKALYLLLRKVFRFWKIDADIEELGNRLSFPAAVGSWTRRTGVKDFGDGNVHSVQCDCGPFLCERANPNNEARLKSFYHRPQGVIAGGLKGFSRLGGKFVGRQVTSGLDEKRKRAIVRDEKVLEEVFRGFVCFLGPSPKTSAADFAPGAVQPANRYFRMFVDRFSYLAVQFQPAFHGIHLAKRNTGLHHAPRSGVHSQEDGFSRFRSITNDVLLMKLAGIDQRVVDTGNGRRETQPFQSTRQLVGDFIQRCGHGDASASFELPGMISMIHDRLEQTTG